MPNSHFKSLNENIWNDIISIDEFDTYSDEYNDCYYGRTYDDGFINIDVTGGTGVDTYTYAWTKDGNAFTNSQNISALAPG